MTKFDTIIVGGGSAGCVLAARLSEDPMHSVLLLEAGLDLTADNTPIAISGASFNDAKALNDRTWQRLVAQRAAGQEPRPYIRGRGLGGSSAINAMVALPGEADDYDGWARDFGLLEWSWAAVAPWFDEIPIPLTTASTGELGPVNEALLRAHPDAARVALTRSATGRRAATNEVYLDAARSRRNLVVQCGTLVDRIEFDGRTAIGVRTADGRYIDGGRVVMAAGAIHSPAVLLRSGVEREGIGRNLQDHAAFPIPLQLVERADFDSLPIAVLARTTTRLRHDGQVVPMDHVDRSLPQFGLLLAAAMSVRSRGSVRLASDDPLVDPVVDFNMLTDERDVDTLRGAIREAEQALDASAFRTVAEPLQYDTSDGGLLASLGDYVHAAGTCRMGLSDDPLAVVDAQCQVIGYEGLLVCDASVMPTLPRANTHLPTVMIAERVSAWLAAS